MDKDRPTITMADETTMPCDFFGYAESLGVQYIDIPGSSLSELAQIFSNTEKTSAIKFVNSSETVVREGFTVLISLQRASVDSDTIRVALRRPYADAAATAEAAEYKAALDILGIKTEEVMP